MRCTPLAARAACVIVCLFVVHSAPAQTHTWNGGNAFGPDSMSNALNWSGGLPVSSSANLTLVFPNSASSFQPNQNIANPLVLQSLIQNGGGYTFQGNGYQFQNLGAAPSISTGGGFVQFNAPIAFIDPTNWSATNNVTLAGILSGGGALGITGSGANQFAIAGIGSNSYTGALSVTSLNQLTLAKNGGTALRGALNADATVVAANFPNQFASTSDISLTNGALLSLNAVQSIRDLAVSNSSSVQPNNSTLTVNGNISSSSGFAVIGNNSGDQLDFNGAQRLISATGAGTSDLLVINASIFNGSFNKVGAGTLQLTSGSSSYNAQNIVSAGVLVTHASSIGTSLLNNATVQLYGGALNSNVISGNGQVIITGFTQYNAAQSYLGGTDVVLGSYLSGEASTITGNVTSSDGQGTIQLNQTANGTLTATLSGGLSLYKYGPGVLSIGGVNTHSGQNQFQTGGLRILSDTAFGSGLIYLGNPITPLTVEAVGNRTIATALDSMPGIVTFIGSNNLHFSHTGNKTINSAMTHNSAGTTTIDGKMDVGPFGSIIVNSGTLVVGNPAMVGGFTAAGPAIVNGGVLTVRSFNFTTLPDVTLAGGVLNAPNGYAIPLGAALQGFGGVTGRVASANGSSIIASGNLAIGDAAHVAGVNLDGELYTNANTVTLLDSNQAVLGSVTQLGTPTSNGTLNAANGAVLNFGRNITGRGTVVSTNALAKAVTVNGDVQGDSAINYIEFTGYVKGVGNFNNVAFSGTFAPGLSPALLTVGNVILTPSNVLDIELGGLLRGGQHDAFDITGQMNLNGQLKLSLINAFNPSLGDQFNLFDGTTLGVFGSYNFPALSSGLVWDTSLLYTQGIAQVVAVPEPALALGVPMMLSMRRRRR